MYYRTPHKLSYFSESFSSGFSPLISLVYISVSSHPMSDAELEALVMKSGEHNSEIGISGMLLYFEGAFMQVLEGTEELVRGLYERIQLDARHDQVTLLLDEYIAERNFPDWAMGLVRLTPSGATQVDGSMRFATVEEFTAYFRDMPEKSLEWLRALSVP